MGVKMMITRREPIMTLLLVLLLVFVGCSSESPTAPTPGGGGGGNTPPVGATVTVTVSNPNPVVSSTSTITATVMNGNTAVPNGTAVEFTTNFGTFTDTASAQTIRTTTGGVASATLTSTTAGQATVTVRVNNVTRTAVVNFSSTGGGGTGVTITSVSPLTSGPSGGGVVTIRGTNFNGPIRVLFGTQTATVVSSSDTEIQVVVPSINLGAAEQFRDVNITVITRAGTTDEKTATAPAPFRYVLEILTPAVYNVSPSSGPNEGNTRITIIGEGFQPPTRVYFGTGGAAGGSLADQVELDVQQVTFGQIIAMTPPALGLGAALRDQQVTMRVLNINTNKDVVIPAAFRYGPGMQITSVGPTQGSFMGGTQVKITGWGFDDPVAVTIGGRAAQPIRVSGTEIVAVTLPLAVTSCDDVSGGISVTNIEDGASAEAEGLEFTYLVPDPNIIGFSPSTVVEGGTMTITVANSGGTNVIFRLGDVTLTPTSATIDGAGTGIFTVVVPTTLSLDSEACPEGGERDVPTTFSLAFENLLTGCEDSLSNAVTVEPAPLASVFLQPQTLSFSAETGASASQTFTIVNNGTAPLTISSITATPTPPFTVAFPGTTTLGPCESLLINVTFNSATAGTFTGNAMITTSIGARAVSLTGTATAPALP